MNQRPQTADPEKAERYRIQTKRNVACMLKGLLTTNREELKNLETPKDEPEAKLTRIANQSFMLAFTAQLRDGTGLDAQFFSYRRPPRRLRPHERRFYEDFDNWPEDEGCLRQRACIEDTVTGDTWYELGIEVLNTVWQRRALHCVLDQCSQGWHFGVWLFTGPAATRGSYFLDRLHTTLNILGDCESDAGFSMLRYEWSVALAAFRGPFRSHKHASTVSTHGEELFKHSNCEDEVFGVLYEPMARDLDMWGPEVGTSKHKSDVFMEAKKRFLSQNFGAESKRERWFAVEKSYENQKAVVNVNLFVLLY